MKDNDLMLIFREILQELKGNYAEHHPNTTCYSYHIEELEALLDKAEAYASID